MAGRGRIEARKEPRDANATTSRGVLRMRRDRSTTIGFMIGVLILSTLPLLSAAPASADTCHPYGEGWEGDYDNQNHQWCRRQRSRSRRDQLQQRLLLGSESLRLADAVQL